MTEEHIIRVARWSAGVEFPIFMVDPVVADDLASRDALPSADQVMPIPARWLVLSEVSEKDQDDEYCLYVLDVHGHIHECLQFETLRIAFDQARWSFGLGETDWRECRLPVPPVDQFDVAALEGAMGSR